MQRQSFGYESPRYLGFFWCEKNAIFFFFLLHRVSRNSWHHWGHQCLHFKDVLYRLMTLRSPPTHYSFYKSAFSRLVLLCNFGPSARTLFIPYILCLPRGPALILNYSRFPSRIDQLFFRFTVVVKAILLGESHLGWLFQLFFSGFPTLEDRKLSLWCALAFSLSLRSSTEGVQ